MKLIPMGKKGDQGRYLPLESVRKEVWFSWEIHPIFFGRKRLIPIIPTDTEYLVLLVFERGDDRTGLHEVNFRMDFFIIIQSLRQMFQLVVYKLFSIVFDLYQESTTVAKFFRPGLDRSPSGSQKKLAHSLPRATLSETCSLLGTDSVWDIFFTRLMRPLKRLLNEPTLEIRGVQYNGRGT